jgi:hypothetical protein
MLFFYLIIGLVYAVALFCVGYALSSGLESKRARVAVGVLGIPILHELGYALVISAIAVALVGLGYYASRFTTLPWARIALVVLAPLAAFAWLFQDDLIAAVEFEKLCGAANVRHFPSDAKPESLPTAYAWDEFQLMQGTHRPTYARHITFKREGTPLYTLKEYYAYLEFDPPRGIHMIPAADALHIGRNSCGNEHKEVERIHAITGKRISHEDPLMTTAYHFPIRKHVTKPRN